MLYAYSYVNDGGRGVSAEDESWIYASGVYIKAGIPVGLYANMNSSVKKMNVQNNATLPESTASGGQIA